MVLEIEVGRTGWTPELTELDLLPVVSLARATAVRAEASASHGGIVSSLLMTRGLCPLSLSSVSYPLSPLRL